MRSKTKYNRITRSIYLLLLLALPLFSRADENTALFDRGNTAFAKGNYQQAANDYQKIIDGGYQSAAVFFNLGNAYYRLGDLPSSLLYYEKAHKLAPSDEDINFNIHFANARTTDKLEQPAEFFITKWWNNFILFFSVSTLAALSILFVIGGFGILVLYLFTNNFIIKRSSFYTGILVIVIGLAFIFMAGQQENYFSSHHQAIIFGNSITAKSTPDANGKPLFIVHEGTKVDVLQKTATSIEVQLPNGNAGWIGVDDAKDI
jgi:tetratricopeptide (TPR) repeat protein